MPTNLTGSAISVTYPGLLHSQGAPLSAGDTTLIYDSVGNQTAVALGRNGSGMSVTGSVSASHSTTASDPGKSLVTKDYLDALLLGLTGSGGLAAYPVGTVYVSTVSTDPSLTFPGSTWTALAPGRVLIGAGSVTDSNSTNQTFTAGVCGGELTHPLIITEIPPHTHSYKCVFSYDYYHCYEKEVDSATDQTAVCTLTVCTNGATGKTGGCDATLAAKHNNLQPYLVVYMWRRAT